MSSSGPPAPSELSPGAADTAVLLSVYADDRPAHLRESLGSLLAQTYRPLHVYLMVDGPVAAELADAIRRFEGPRLSVRHSTRNRGLAHSLNELIGEALSEGYEFLARMDADDISADARIERQIAFLREHPEVDVLGTCCEEIDEEGTVLFRKRMPTSDAELKRRILFRSPFIHPTVVFRRRVFETGLRYHTDTHLTEDMFLWVDMARAGFVFANLPQLLLRYRIGSRFYEKRSGFRKAVSEFKAKRYIARQLPADGISRAVVPVTAFVFRMLPAPVLKACYRFLR